MQVLGSHRIQRHKCALCILVSCYTHDTDVDLQQKPKEYLLEQGKSK